MIVDLPQPLRPTMPTRSPVWMVRSTSWRMIGGGGWDFLTIGYLNVTFSSETNGPGKRRSGAGGRRIDTPLSSTGMSISALAVRWYPTRSRLSLKRPPVALFSIPILLSSFFCRDFAWRSLFSSPAALPCLIFC